MYNAFLMSFAFGVFFRSDSNPDNTFFVKPFIYKDRLSVNDGYIMSSLSIKVNIKREQGLINVYFFGNHAQKSCKIVYFIHCELEILHI